MEQTVVKIKDMLNRFSSIELLMLRAFVMIVHMLSLSVGCGFVILVGTVDVCFPFLRIFDKFDRLLDFLTLNPIIFLWSSFCNRKVLPTIQIHLGMICI